MKIPTPYRSLGAERRAALILHAIRSRKGARAGYAQRLVARGGGFRAATLMTWPAARLANEVVRLNAESPEDELELLQLLYVELEPQIQITFLEAAGVSHELGVIPEELEPPFTDEDGVRRGAVAVREKYESDGERYLRTIARYNAGAWPGVGEIVAELQQATAGDWTTFARSREPCRSRLLSLPARVFRSP